MSKKLTTTAGVAATARRSYARMTARSHALPDFVVIGSQKAGTTSLAGYFAGHPDVFWSQRGEIHYFDWSYDRSVSWYRGPLLPYPAKAAIKVPVSSADAVLRYDPATGLFDTSYAAAWQLGRLLAQIEA